MTAARNTSLRPYARGLGVRYLQPDRIKPKLPGCGRRGEGFSIDELERRDLRDAISALVDGSWRRAGGRRVYWLYFSKKYQTGERTRNPTARRPIPPNIFTRRTVTTTAAIPFRLPRLNRLPPHTLSAVVCVGQTFQRGNRPNLGYGSYLTLCILTRIWKYPNLISGTNVHL